MKTITASTFERFTGKGIEGFLPEGVNVNDVYEIRVEPTKLSDLMDKVPQDYSHDGSMGQSRGLVLYFGICEDGEILPSPAPDYRSSSNYAHTQTVEEDGIAIGEAWGEELNKIKYVVEYNRDLDDWEGGHLTDERFILLHLVRQDDEERIKKIRRRCEDALRKSDSTTILRIATIMGVKLDQ